MTPADVFANPELAEHSEAVSLALVDTMTGQTYPVALAAMFSTFVAICIRAGLSPGREWDAMMAMLEGRKAATHGAPRVLQ